MYCNVFRMTVNGQARASDLTSLLMLHSIATAFKSLLRPSDLTSHDKGPAESLAGEYIHLSLDLRGRYIPQKNTKKNAWSSYNITTHIHTSPVDVRMKLR